MPDDASSPAHRAWLDRLQAGLDTRSEQHLLRRLQRIDSAPGPEITCEGVPYLQFCTNNYIGLATDPELIDAAREATARYGTGSGASRLVAGSLALHHELEAALARLKGTEAALLFPSGYMANLAVLTTFAGEGDQVVSDKLNHASLLDAARFSGAGHRTFPHRNAARAEQLLMREADPQDSEPLAAQRFLVTDSIFSMDGDLADLPSLCAVAQRTGALVIIDEAHATGVLGARGAGLAELQQVESGIALSIGTLSKALGSVGGFVAGPQAAIDTLVNSARPFIYTTALPPACSAASLAALRIVEREPSRRARVLAMAEYVRGELAGMGYDCGDSQSPVIPIFLGSAAGALAAAAFLRERGLFIPAIRPPTVPPNSARLRISLMSTHTDAHIAKLLAALRALRDHLPPPPSPPAPRAEAAE
jgi:8-amino-7-oxononanoate synthase